MTICIFVQVQRATQHFFQSQIQPDAKADTRFASIMLTHWRTEGKILLKCRWSKASYVFTRTCFAWPRSIDFECFPNQSVIHWARSLGRWRMSLNNFWDVRHRFLIKMDFLQLSSRSFTYPKWRNCLFYSLPLSYWRHYPPAQLRVNPDRPPPRQMKTSWIVQTMDLLLAIHTASSIIDVRLVDRQISGPTDGPVWMMIGRFATWRFILHGRHFWPSKPSHSL